MNDRFKFRAWYDGRYIYKDLCDSNYYTEDGKCIGLANTLPNDLPWEQCTGKKDKNGKLIYEGNIVVNSDGFKYIIRWHEAYGYWASVSMEKFWWIMDESKEYEIIGNIHENPELLKESK